MTRKSQKGGDIKAITQSLRERDMTPAQLIELAHKKVLEPGYDLTAGTAVSAMTLAMPGIKEQEIKADHGNKFVGRKPGSVGPIRRAIAKLLARNPEMKNPELWETISRKPPKGWDARDNRYGKYLEGGQPLKSMEYRRFCNVCAEERKKVKAKITG